MTIDKLNVFCIVYETQSIKDAAEILMAAPSVISRTIKQIEEEYQITLFTRIHHHIQRTKQADTFYLYATRMLEIDRQSHSIVNDYDYIRIGSTSIIGTYLLPPLLSRMNSEKTTFRYRLQVDTQEKILFLLESQALDVGFVEDKLIYKPLVKYERIGGDQLIPVLPPDSPFLGKQIGFEDLRTMNIITRGEESCERKIIEHIFSAHQQPFTPMIECSSILTIVELVHYGLGASLMSDFLAKKYIRNHYLSTCQIENEKLERNFYAATRRDSILSPVAHRLIAELGVLSSAT